MLHIREVRSCTYQVNTLMLLDKEKNKKWKREDLKFEGTLPSCLPLIIVHIGGSSAEGFITFPRSAFLPSQRQAHWTMTYLSKRSAQSRPLEKISLDERSKLRASDSADAMDHAGSCILCSLPYFRKLMLTTVVHRLVIQIDSYH